MQEGLATIRVHRAGLRAGWPWYTRIYVDGVFRGKLKGDQDLEIPVTAGKHVICARQELLPSRRLGLKCGEGEVTTIVARTNGWYFLACLYFLWLPPVWRTGGASIAVWILLGCLSLFFIGPYVILEQSTASAKP